MSPECAVWTVGALSGWRVVCSVRVRSVVVLVLALEGSVAGPDLAARWSHLRGV